MSARRALAGQFLRFGTVGAAGFVINAGTLYGLRGRVGPYWAESVAYLVAASANWAMNRHWTFRDGRAHPARRQWTLAVAGGLAGLAPNLGVYFALLALSPFCAAHPIGPLAAGTGLGMAFNFALARRVVFR